MKATILTLFLAVMLTSCSWFESIKTKEKFYCKVNGEKFRPDKDNSPVGGIGSDPLRVIWNKEKKTLFISSRNSPREISFIIILSKEEIEAKSYSLKPDSTSSKAYFTPSNSPSAPVEDIVSQQGDFTITNVDGHNISGTFEFTCKSAKSGKEYKITNGEFNDISYY